MSSGGVSLPFSTSISIDRDCGRERGCETGHRMLPGLQAADPDRLRGRGGVSVRRRHPDIPAVELHRDSGRADVELKLPGAREQHELDLILVAGRDLDLARHRVETVLLRTHLVNCGGQIGQDARRHPAFSGC